MRGGMILLKNARSLQNFLGSQLTSQGVVSEQENFWRRLQHFFS